MHASLISMAAAAGAMLAVGALAAPRSPLPLADNSPTAVSVDVELVRALEHTRVTVARTRCEHDRAARRDLDPAERRADASHPELRS